MPTSVAAAPVLSAAITCASASGFLSDESKTVPLIKTGSAHIYDPSVLSSHALPGPQDAASLGLHCAMHTPVPLPSGNGSHTSPSGQLAAFIFARRAANGFFPGNRGAQPALRAGRRSGRITGRGACVIIISIPKTRFITSTRLPCLAIADLKTKTLVRLCLFAYFVLRTALICLRVTGLIPLTGRKPYEKKQ